MNVHVSPRYQLDADARTFASDVIDGLSQQPKILLPKYFYDEAGSHLFEQITRLPEYYPTRVELGILRNRAPEIAAILPERAALVEFGAGAATKVRRLLDACDIAAYVPVDISGDFLRAQASTLGCDFPELAIYPVAADFTAPFEVPREIAAMPKVGFFPGSTLGNFDPDDARAFMQLARRMLGHGATMLIGIDLEKDERLLNAAYNDAAGVTAQFNLNVLTRINRELGGDFDLSAFQHDAIYNPAHHRVEMHLVSAKPQTAHVLGRNLRFSAGESIHTESSYKYSIERFYTLARSTGWTPLHSWTDDARMFSVHALRA